MSLKRLVNIERNIKARCGLPAGLYWDMDDYVKKSYARRLEPQAVHRF